MIDLPGLQVIEPLHEGARSLVVRCAWKGSDAPVVVKAAKGGAPTLQQLARWSHEHAVLARITAEGVPKPLALEVHRHRPLLVLEDVGATSLRQLMAGEPLPIATVAEIGVALAEALGAVHARGLIHKDVNPSNAVMNPKTGRVQLIDFGIASRLAQEIPDSTGQQRIEGTAAYMSPEQTGRMNRVLDYRSDFYSLGATLYELLTGAPPLSGRDWLELVHAHMARQPAPPESRRAGIPAALSGIVMKLLRKAAEDRYQSARALAADLRRCRDALASGAAVPAFTPGEADYPERLQPSQRLYGRDGQRAALLGAYDEAVRAARPVVVMVAGYSGVGKSSLVREIHRPIVERRGFFAAGKFDPFQRNLPYRAVLQAFADLARQVLASDPPAIAHWRGVIADALGPNAGVMTDLVPEVGLILGPQPEVAALSPAETQNRFHFLVQSFTQAFARPEHPLVLFFDDLQWADLPTLRLLEQLAGHLDGAALVIGAYRDNQVDATHPLTVTLDAIERAGVTVRRLALAPLSPGDLGDLTADVLGAPAEATAPLAAILHEKTDGNPFFVHRLLGEMHERGLLRRDPGARAWAWDAAGIAAMGVSENVADLMKQKLATLPPETRRVMQLAACIGGRFDLGALAIVAERGLLETGDALWPALEARLVAPVGDGYRLLGGMQLLSPGDGDAADVAIGFRFVHDQVQQAAYAEVDEARQREAHLRIGRLMCAKLSAADRDERLFEIVNHFARALDLVEGADERGRVLELAAAAGDKARASAAFPIALGYMRTAVELLPHDAWRRDYRLALDLHLRTAEAAYLDGAFDEMARVVKLVRQHAESRLDEVRAVEVQIDALVAQKELVRAVDMGIEALAMLGVRAPRDPGMHHIVAGLVRAKATLAGKSTAALRHLPPMTDPTRLAVMRVISRILAPAYMCAPKLLPVLVFRQVALTAKFGIAPTSAYAFGAYGMINGGVLGDADTAERFGQLALDVLEDTKNEQQRPRVMQLAHSFTRHWKHHLRVTLAPLLEAFQHGKHVGDFEYAAYACLIYSFNSLCAGRELGAVEEELATFIAAMARFRHEQNHRYLMLWRQSIHNLRGLAADPTVLSGACYDERTALAEHEKGSDITGLFYAHYNRMVLAYLFGRTDRAAEAAAQAGKWREGVTGVVLIPRWHFYAALVELRRGKTGVRGHLRKLDKWAKDAPMNFAHLALLVRAELARVTGRDADAIRRYNDAIAAARAHEYLHDEALANELAAEFYLARGLEQVAAAYVTSAHVAYARWGAAAKAHQLREKYPTLLPSDADRAGATTLTTTSGSLSKESLDVVSVLKASQAISDQLIFDELLRRLMKIAIENAGATSGALLLENGGSWTIAAVSAVDERDVTLPRGAPLEAVDGAGRRLLPAAMIHYAAHTKKPVLLDDADVAQSFARDPYVLDKKPRSALCVPLSHQGQLVGVVYLENDLARGAFTTRRIEVLEWLSAQMAISISHARLYRDLSESRALLEETNRTLERQVAERTREAVEARRQAELASLAKSRFLANTSHEIRTPLTALLGFAELLHEPSLGERERLAYAETLLRNGEHLLSLLNNILDLSKVEAGKMDIERIPCAPGELIAGVAALMRVRAADKRLAFEARLDAPIPALILGDPTRLRQILINLTGNAIKFTERGRVTMAARGDGEGESRRVVIEVRDTGIGMSPAQLEKLFQPFEQGDAAMTRNYGGSGLGLAVCKHLAEALGGSISVESREGYGSAFSVALPVVVPAGTPLLEALPEEQPPSARARDAAPPVASRARILVAEDGEDNRMLLETLLGKWGYEVALVADGRAAVAAALAAARDGRTFDVVIMDMQMPILDGYAAAAELRAQGYRGAIVALTAHAMVGEREKCLASGCDGYLSKPLERKALRAALERHAAAGVTS